MYWGEELVAIYNEAYIGLCLRLFMHVQLANINGQVWLGRSILP
jgi:hypothetical protein